MNSKFIYGVSMHDGISKVLSLKLDREIPLQTQPQVEVNNHESEDLNQPRQSPSIEAIQNEIKSTTPSEFKQEK